MAQLLEVGADFAGQRLDNFLGRHLKDLPKARLYRMLRKGEVRVNKGRVKPCYRVNAGDQVRLPPIHTYQQQDESDAVSKPKPVAKSAIKQAEQLLKHAILYEDPALLIINKPAGLAVHGGSGVSYGLIELLRLVYPQYIQLDLVHRIDRDTSGCILISKKHSMLRAMHLLLREGGLTKVYHALLPGILQPAVQDVDMPLRKYHLSSGERLVTVDEAGQAALTKFKLLQEFKIASLVQANPITGRTHQIRVHAKYIGKPIAGDDKYGDKDFDKMLQQYGLKRLFLHAQQLIFKHPKDMQLINVQAPYDSCLTNTLENLAK